MNHPHYEIVPLSGTDLLPTIDSGHGTLAGKPSEPRQLARQLARFRAEQPVYHPDVPASERVDPLDGKSQPAAASAVDILLHKVGPERVVDLLHARPRLRVAMEERLEAELAAPSLPVDPRPSSRADAGPGRSRVVRPSPPRS